VRNLVGVNDVVVLAEMLRALAGESRAPFDLLKVVAVLFPSAVVTGKDLPPQVNEAVTVTTDGPLIVYRRGISTAERRFAIAHGLGHLIYDFRGDRTLTDRERELRADVFARELLVPRREFAWCLDGLRVTDRDLFLDQVDVVANAFHVQPVVITERIRELMC
jgi:Zn-dependent peptidase ImmA (M78 family)